MNSNMKSTIKNELQAVKNTVYIQLYLDEKNSHEALEMIAFTQEIADLHDLIHLEVLDQYDLMQSNNPYQVERAPAIILLNKNKEFLGVKYYGLPAGYEIRSFIQGIIAMSEDKLTVSPNVLTRIEAINQPVTLKVFITLGCPHCPQAVHNAHKIAMLNKNITAEMIDAQLFADYSSQYQVSGVPKIIINEQFDLLGNVPLTHMLDEIEKL